MYDRQQECFDRAMLTEFLNEQLDENIETTILKHINDCDQCQEALENIAAGKEAWSELKTQLADHLDLDVTGETTPFRSRDRDIEMEKLKEYLGPTDNPDMLGRLGTYEVCGLVGRGSTGVVVKALDTRLNRYVAIKVLSPSFSSNGPARTRFEREGRSVAAVSHEHVVPIHSVNEYRGLPFIVMHYVDGGSLHQRIEKNGPLDTCEVVRIGMQIARGLAAAHGQGIIHRDVKPANVMLESGVDRAMVSDFGLARVADEAAMTRSGVIAGTPQYMSPEQAMGDPIDPRSDLFSLGSVLYAACTGRAPFRSETVFGVIKRVCESQPRPIREINPNIAPWLEALIRKLHEKDRENRFESAGQVADILNAELAHLQSPSFVPVPDRPWFVVNEPAKPAKQVDARTGSYWGKWAIAGMLLMFGTFSVMAASGMIQFSPKHETAWNLDEESNDKQPKGENPKTAIVKKYQKRSDASNGNMVIAMAPKTVWQDEEVNEHMDSREIEISASESFLAGNCDIDCECPDCEGVCDSDCKRECENSECENSKCESGSCESASKALVVNADRGIAGRLVAVEKTYPGDVDGYLVYLPLSYEKSKKEYPVIMFLTGGCGVGGDISDLQCWCLPRTIQKALRKQNIDLENEHKKLMLDSFIVVAPHMTDGSFEERQFFEQEVAIAKMLDDVQNEYRVDASRVYLTGSGRGGHGTWGLATRMPERFAAIAPIRGMRFGITDYQTLASMPIWIGHNQDDDEVEFEETEAVVAKLGEMGTEFFHIESEDASSVPYLSHSKILTSCEDECWPDLYAFAPLYKWFLNYENQGGQDLVRVTTRVAHESVAIMPFGDDESGFVIMDKDEANDKWRETAKPTDDTDLEEFDSNVEKNIDVQPNGKLLVQTHLGHVRLKAIDGNQVQVKVLRKVRAETREQADAVFEAQKIDFDVSNFDLEEGRDAVVLIKLDEESEAWKSGVNFKLMECEIGLPAEYNVDINTSAGHISAPDIRGIVKMQTSGGHIQLDGCSDKANLRTSGGHITIGKVTGDLVGKTSGGNITVANVSGDAELKTSGGHIIVEESDGSVSAFTAGGNIKVLMSQQPRNDMVLSTSAGNVVVTLSKDIKLDVVASASIGKVKGDAVKNTTENNNEAEFSINGGGPTLEVNSSAGNIELKYQDP